MKYYSAGLVSRISLFDNVLGRIKRTIESSESQLGPSSLWEYFWDVKFANTEGQETSSWCEGDRAVYSRFLNKIKLNQIESKSIR